MVVHGDECGRSADSVPSRVPFGCTRCDGVHADRKCTVGAGQGKLGCLQLKRLIESSQAQKNPTSSGFFVLANYCLAGSAGVVGAGVAGAASSAAFCSASA